MGSSGLQCLIVQCFFSTRILSKVSIMYFQSVAILKLHHLFLGVCYVPLVRLPLAYIMSEQYFVQVLQLKE